jgi:hypothetical protein
MNIRSLMSLVATGVLTSGCSWGSMESFSSSASPPPPPGAQAAVAPPPGAFPVDRMVGNWGVASYRDPKDKGRVEAQARAACKQPYVISKGPTDGVIMYVADDTTPHELTLKYGEGGKTYLGFAGPPGDAQDREMLTLNDRLMVARYVDPDTNNRYGTLIYVRCGASRAT